MSFETVADIYAANASAGQKLVETLDGVTSDEALLLPDGEKWSIQQIAEHIAIVDSGTARICSKLIDEAKASGKPSDGRVSFSAEFGDKSKAIAGMKVEAPDRVQPTGQVPVGESLQRLEISRQMFEGLRTDLERFDLSEPKFPHPFFGGLTAVEWLVVGGGHMARHTRQIERFLDKIR
jgi:hypothetical protein